MMVLYISGRFCLRINIDPTDKADIPITTGNSYSASGALWAAADAVRRMGLIKVEKGKRIKAKTMVLGATGAIGSVCCRLLAKAFDEVTLVGRNTAKLLALQESIHKEDPDVKLRVTTLPDKLLADMDLIVTATSGAGKKILDITKVQPGCIITDVARPLDLSPEDVAKRPDVLVIESGEIELPGNPEMKSIGLPDKVTYACMAETIVLALEGRFEVFTIGRDIEWEKVREIYKLGLKHGMKLAAISGVNGVFTDEDITEVKRLALDARAQQKQSGSKKKPEPKKTRSKKFVPKKSAVKKPGPKKAVAKTSGTKKSVAKKPGTKKSVAKKPATEKSAAKKSGSKQSK